MDIKNVSIARSNRDISSRLLESKHSVFFYLSFDLCVEVPSPMTCDPINKLSLVTFYWLGDRFPSKLYSYSTYIFNTFFFRFDLKEGIDAYYFLMNFAKIDRFSIFLAVVVRKPGKKLSSCLASVRKILRGIGLVLTHKQKDRLIIGNDYFFLR